MIKNYLKLGIRNLRKNRLSSIINIGGLGLAVGCCLVVFIFLDWCVNEDDFHTKRDKICVVERVEEKAGNQQFWGNSPAPMGPMLKKDFPQIKNSARLNYVGSVIKQGDNVFRESITFTDDAFYDMFDFPIKWGNRRTFTDPDAIVLTEELSEKLFGKVNSIGKTVNARFNIEGKEIVENFTVKGVFAQHPLEASFYFAALVPFRKSASLGLNGTDDWKKTVNMTFVEMAEKASPLPNASQCSKYLGLYNAANTDAKIAAYHFQPLKTMHFHAYKVSNSNFNSTHIIGLIMLLAIAIAILLLVCFNYMNIAVASASQRLKEIGVRKVMGSRRGQIILQFLVENLILCLIGVALGMLLAKLLFLPWFSDIGGIDLSHKLFENVRHWLLLLVLVLVTVLGGAAYPAVYISALKPISIVKGKMMAGSRNRFRKTLLAVQFLLTFLGISMALAFVQQNKLARAKPWGYKPAGHVVVQLDESAKFDLFKSALVANHKILSVTGSVQPLGRWARQLVIKSEGKEQTIQSLQALPGFAGTLGIKILRGRDLSDQYATDETSSVLVNQTFLTSRNWTTGIGKTIEYGDRKYVIVGETNDFRFEEFSHKVEPFALFGCTHTEVKFVYAGTESGLFQNGHSVVNAIWKANFPNLPFDYYYQDAVFEQYFLGFTQVAQVMTATSVIMVVVSISGIFGLALLVLGKKMKEISVRKVLGAGMGNISFQIIREFLLAIGVAFLIGFPISYLLVHSIFVQVTPESTVSFIPLIISFAGIVVMTILSILWHLYKAYTSNPTTWLKEE